MRGKKAKKLRKEIYKEYSIRHRTSAIEWGLYVRPGPDGKPKTYKYPTVHTDEMRKRYQAAKKGVVLPPKKD